ncbi:hypothetical protein EV401DRAFT_1886366 [Pisolithus croceorrhizus]|nr:hypothetical protein EV401DRAFT_1886366 [Pisolithus croceorrhizus]
MNVISKETNQAQRWRWHGYHSKLIDFLLGLALSPLTADAAIHEIQSWARPTSLFGTPPPSPLTFPVSPHSSHDSSSPRVQAIYPSVHTPAPPPLAPSRVICTDQKQPATSTHHPPATQVTSTTVQANPTTSSGKCTLSASSSSQSTLSMFTTAFSHDVISSSGFSCVEVDSKILKSLLQVGHAKLQTFILETAKGEKCWQQHHKGTYFDVPGPDVVRLYYLVMKGTQISILATWMRTALYVNGIKGACYVGVPSVKEGVEHMIKAIELGESFI